MSDNMIERVAAAVLEYLRPGAMAASRAENGVTIVPPDLWSDCLGTARVAIEAMREPTDAAIDLVYDQFDWGPSGYFDAPQGAADARKVWTAMIDVMLKDAP